MLLTRRDIGRVALGAATAARLMAAKPNSKFGGVQIGAITYSFRTLPGSAEEILKYCVDCGISAVELMSGAAESYAGAPAAPRAPAGAQGGAKGGGKKAAGPEQRAAQQKAAGELKQWRLSVSMDKYKAFRKMYADAGVTIYAFKLPPTMSMSDQEYEYIWNVAQTLGAGHITMELPTDDALLKRVADYAAQRKLRIAFHTHGQGGASGFDKVLAASPYTALNFDVGHYYGVTGESPAPLVEKYHDRIASLHLKDRKGPASGAGGANMPWGQGQTPLKEILQLMKRKKYKFPASIEYEYNTPAGSDVLAEVKRCVAYCKQALA
jgi:sugar phosphate isomerase/epimerase